MQQHKSILRELNQAGHKAYFVGGCVRDHLLQRWSKDVDIATSADSQEIADLFSDTKKVGAAFGVVLVNYDGASAEVATFRTDGNYSDSRHPDTVTFTRNLREDLLRRDFTINAITMDADGHILDPLHGEKDLALGLVRAVGNPSDRFIEDPLRMLRAIRFAAQLGFRVEDSTYKAIQDCSPLITKVSAERVQMELSKILTSGMAADGLWALYCSGLLHHFLPEFNNLFHCEQNPVYHPEGNVLIHTLKLLEQLEPGCSLTLALAALLHDIGKPATFALKDGQPTFHGHEEAGAPIAEDILRRLKYPNEVIEVVVSHVAQHMTFRVSKLMRKAKLMRFLRQDNFSELLELHRLDATAGSGNLGNYEHCTKMLVDLPPAVLRPARLVTGEDLIAYGLTPGPRFKEVLEGIETLQLEGKVSTRDEALTAMHDLVMTLETA